MPDECQPPCLQVPARHFSAFALHGVKPGEKGLPILRAQNAARVAAMLRHAACEASRRDWPFREDSARYVAGHGEAVARRAGGDTHPRFSYLPLPSPHGGNVSGQIGCVLVAEPYGGDGTHAAWAGRALHGSALIDEDVRQPVAQLEYIETGRSDVAHVMSQFAGRSRAWISATPVVLPGHDDADEKKAARLFGRGCHHAGLPTGAIEFFDFVEPPGSIVAGRFFLPDYLRGLPLRWVRIRLSTAFSGPLAIGGGRHVGLGIFVVDHT